MYIVFWTFVVKCTEYGNCEQAAFKNAKGNCFLFLFGEIKQGMQRLSVMIKIKNKKIKKTWQGCPRVLDCWP